MGRNDGGRKNDHPLKVVVVDDNEDAALLMCDLLRLNGHEPYAVVHATEALETIRQVLPHAVLLDIGMPVVNGYQIAARIRADEELSGIMLIAVTGYGSLKDRELSMIAGFDHHLVKPVSNDLICAILDGLHPAVVDPKSTEGNDPE
jgi:CheY-like chemotaxis protein